MKAIFENATFSDAITKAARVAPSRGEAFDKAHGIVLTLDAERKLATVRATDMSIFYLQVIDAIEIQGSASWRIHAGTIGQVASKLPIGSNKTVTLEGNATNSEVTLKSGRTTAKFRTSDIEYYPEWGFFDSEALEIVPNLGARIQQVEWAASREHSASFAGIHLDGQRIVATDSHRFATVPCEAKPIYRPVTIPADSLKPIASGLRDVAIGIDQNMFLMMPDVSTQIKVNIYDREYPNVYRALERTWTHKVTLRREELIAIIERAVIFAQRDRLPRLTMLIGKGEVAVMCTDEEIGLLGDVVEVPGQADHKRIQLIFTPQNLTAALQASPGETVDLTYSIESVKLPLKIEGGQDFLALVMPRTQKEEDE